MLHAVLSQPESRFKLTACSVQLMSMHGAVHATMPPRRATPCRHSLSILGALCPPLVALLLQIVDEHIHRVYVVDKDDEPRVQVRSSRGPFVIDPAAARWRAPVGCTAAPLLACSARTWHCVLHKLTHLAANRG